jgi:muramoyltetrapeptide carboxypeptidase
MLFRFCKELFDLQGPGRYLDPRLTRPRIRKPPRIRTGDVVGVIAPSGVPSEERLHTGVSVLEGWGLRVRLGDAVLARHGYLAGDDETRGADLQRMVDDPRVRAVFCARGGYGSQRLVPTLNLGPLAEAPKAIVGYSDATALLAALGTLDVVGIHGPMVADDIARGLSVRSEETLRRVLSDPEWLWEVEVPVTIRSGQARGRLMGGCLSVLISTLGTPYAPDTRGAVLFLEDVAERPYRLDRLLTQLAQAGKLDGLAGLVFGAMDACPMVDGIGPLEVIRSCCSNLPYPVAFGLNAGHTVAGAGCENLALPLGIDVELDTASGRLAALEAAVV